MEGSSKEQGFEGKRFEIYFAVFYCVTLGKLPKLSVFRFPRGFIFRLSFNADPVCPVPCAWASCR